MHPCMQADYSLKAWFTGAAPLLHQPQPEGEGITVQEMITRGRERDAANQVGCMGLKAGLNHVQGSFTALLAVYCTSCCHVPALTAASRASTLMFTLCPAALAPPMHLQGSYTALVRALYQLLSCRMPRQNAEQVYVWIGKYIVGTQVSLHYP